MKIRTRRRLVANARRRKPNPMRLDPTRTAGIRRAFAAVLKRRFARLRLRLLDLVVRDDAFGLRPAAANPFGVNASYFETCPRDERGRCLPGDGGGASGGGGDSGGKAPAAPKAAASYSPGSGEGTLYVTRPGAGSASPADRAMAKFRRDRQSSGVGQTHTEGSQALKDAATHIEPFAADVGAMARDIARANTKSGEDVEVRFKQGALGASVSIAVGTESVDPTRLLIEPHPRGLRVQGPRGKKVIPHEATDREVAAILHKVAGYKLPDALRGPTANVTTNAGRWGFLPTAQQVRAFRAWLREQVRLEVLGRDENELWQKYIEDGFRKGAGRAFDDTRPAVKAAMAKDQAAVSDFYAGTKDEFLRSAFARPVAVEKVKLLASRSFDDLEEITSAMSLRMVRKLTDGLVQGKGPREVAKDLADEVDITRTRALVIAKTELSRAHSEGQLTALEELGVEEVGVAVEWTVSGLGTTALGNPSPCDLCAPLEGVVLTIAEARGMLPRHPG